MTIFDLTIQWAVLIVVVVFMLIRGQLTLFHPSSIYLAFHMLVFCIRPTLVAFEDFDFAFNYMELSPTDELLRQTLWISSGSLLLFVFSFCLTTNERGITNLVHGFRVSPQMRRSFIIMVIMFLPLGLYSIFFSQIAGERVGGVFIMTGSSGYANDAQQVFIPITILSMVMFKWKWWSFLPFLLFVYFRLTQGWARWTVILPFLAVVMFYCWQKSKNIPPLRWLIPVPFLFLIFNQMSHQRMFVANMFAPSNKAVSIVESKASIMEEQLAFRRQWDTLDFANFDYLAYVLDKVPRETGKYSYGVQHLQLFTEPIPRKLWKNKPIGAPVKYFDLNDYGDFNGLTVSIIGDGWISGGWVGVIINMSLTGMGLGLFYNWFCRNQFNIFKVTFFIVTNSVLLQMFRDGGIVSMAKFMLFTQLPILVWWFFHNWEMRGEEGVVHDGNFDTEDDNYYVERY
ncbi:oligosaccharide repeat unit polymerase [Opitutales bacterium]|nr:oligosaccharide repeat unit polymerase [Opitutales bacterium]